MTIREFLARLKRLRTAAEETRDLSSEARSAVDGLMGAFRAAYEPEQLKRAMADDLEVSSDLEERLTTATLLLNQERTRGA